MSDALLREFAAADNQSFAVVAEMVGRRFRERVSDEMMGQALHRLIESGLLWRAIDSDRKRYGVTAAGWDWLRARAERQLTLALSILGILTALLGAAAAVWANLRG